MLLNELTKSHTDALVDSWERHFGFYGDNADFYRATLYKQLVEDLSSLGLFEDRFGTMSDDDCKLMSRIGEKGSVEISFNVNKGTMSASEYDPLLGESEQLFRKDVERVGFLYYTS